MMPRPRWVRLWAWRAVALVPAFVIASYLANTFVPEAIRLEALAVLLVTLARPAYGLMLVALIAPLGDVVVPIFGVPPVHHAETLVIAFLAGWLSARAGADESSSDLPANMVDAMWLFAGVLIASVARTALQLHRENPAELRNALVSLWSAYLLTDDLIGAHAAAQLLEGLGLLAAAAVIARSARDRFWVRLSLIAAGVVASLASGLLVFHLAPMRTLVRHAAIGTRRYSAIVGDVNATASLYVLLAAVSIGVALSAGRTRLMWLLAAAIMLAGLALTGSAAGVLAAAAVFAAAVMLWISLAEAPRSKPAAMLLIAVVVIGGILFARSPRSASSLEMRAGFTQATMRFVEARPLFGVGVGRYYPLSKIVLPPRLSWVYGRENAHDFYLQVLAEIGLVGAAAFAWLLMTALRAPITRVWKGRANVVTVGCVAGVIAYLVTALTGHPFLVPEAVVPFWIVLGCLVVPELGAAAGSRRRRAAAIGCAFALLMMSPFQGTVPRVRLAPSEEGFGPWQRDTAGRQFREAGTFSSLFVAPAITVVEIPVRLAGNPSLAWASVGVSVPGLPGTGLHVGRDWTTVVIRLPIGEPLVPFQRINLEVTRADGTPPGGDEPRLDVGQIRVIEAAASPDAAVP